MTRRPPELGLIPAIHRATHRVGLWLERTGTPGVTQAESHVLAQLAARGPQTVSALHKGLEHRRSTLTHVLDRLSERGWITRAVTAGDRRSFTIALTTPGARAARATHAALADLERAALRGVPAARVEELRALLDGLAQEEPRAAPRRPRP